MPLTKSDHFKIVSNKLKSEDFTVVNFQKNSLGEVKGYLGNHSSLVLTIAKENGNEEKHQFFMKSLPKVGSQKDYVTEIKGPEKEQFFYAHFIPLLQENSIHLLDNIVPRCFHSDKEDFVYEDLTIRGYKSPPTRTFFDIDRIKMSLKAIARFHSAFIILEEKKKINLKEAFPDIFTSSFYGKTKLTQAFVKSSKHGLQACIDLLEDDDKISKESLKEKVFESCDLLAEVEEPSKKFRNTLCHGDLWACNFMFKLENGKPVDVMIVDFQSYRYGPPGQDLMAFLHFTTSREFRRKHLGEMLDFYFEELNGNLDLEGLITKEEFFDSCDCYKRFALTQACTHSLVIHMSDEIARELLADPEFAAKVMYENKYEFVVNGFSKCPIYKKLSLDALKELRDFYSL